MRYLVSTCYFLLIVEILVILRSFFYARREKRKTSPAFFPKAAVIAPHYGWDFRTAENVKRVLKQDYAGDHLVYLVTNYVGDAGYDSSYRPLLELVEGYTNVQVVLAPNIIDDNLPRSQKIQNLMSAIELLPNDVEVIAFIDADAEIRSDWLSQLVQPLKDPKVGATVGGRFYLVTEENGFLKDLATVTEAAWVNFQLAIQGDHPLTMVWGGSNAIRRKLISQGKVLERWARAAIEDHNLTFAVRSLNQKIHFVPEAISICHTKHRSWKQVLEFTNRQTIMTYWMRHKIQWAILFMTVVPKTLILFSVPFLALSMRTTMWLFTLIPFLLLEIYFYRHSFFVLPDEMKHNQQIRENIKRTSFVISISGFVAAVNAVWAIFQNEIVWGNVRYRILSDTECQVLGRVTNE
ncbi:hypothetical protein CMK22_15650 [Candidatus Poribacteria bacterium]|nr:hypothetical protein [Candidatus Poribacteria bacterium]